MKNNRLKKACTTLLKIGCIGFGGGNALIPVIQDEIVDKEKIITQEEYEEDIVVASITPGALPVELSAGIGKRLYGRRGMLLGATCMAFPGALLTIALLAILSGVPDTLYEHVAFLTVGIMAYIASLLTGYVESTFKTSKNETRGFLIATCIITILVFAITGGKNVYKVLSLDVSPRVSLSTINVFAIAFFIILFTNGKKNFVKLTMASIISVLYVCTVGKNPIIDVEWFSYLIKTVMIVLSAYGFWNGVSKSGGKKNSLPYREIILDLVTVVLGVGLAAVVAMIVMPNGFVFLWKGFLSSIMSFGGGDAYLTVADGMFVEGGFITEDAFYSQLVPLVNIIPGSILCKTLAGVGYLSCLRVTGSTILSVLVAACGFSCSVFASCGVFAVIGDFYHALSDLYVFQAIKKWIRPIVSGLMLTVIMSLVYQGVKFGKALSMGYKLIALMIVVYALETFLSKKNKSNAIRMLIAIVVSYVAGWVMYVTL